jgi:hypothetical protein
VLEIADIYRRQGNYDLAVEELRNAMKHFSDEVIRKELIINIAYMRIIKNILCVHSLGLLPYEEIPDKVKKEIEKEFHNWKNLD